MEDRTPTEVWLMLDRDGNRCHIIEEVPFHWRAEHDAPHCFACNKAISPDAPIHLYRTKERIIWWHGWCAPDAPNTRFFEP